MIETLEEAEVIIAELKQALKDDESDLWRVTNAVKKAIKGRSWMLEGRGCYAYDDDEYRKEFGYAFDEILDVIKDVQNPAQKRFHLVMSKG